jgi:uncharacterized protein (DUF488 family)
MKTKRSNTLQIFTVGHSNRSLEDFILVLAENNIHALADIRRYPSSRKFPHFNQGALRHQLAVKDIHYVWFEQLGGFRHSSPHKKSPNTGLESPGFRNYADYMLTDEFGMIVQDLLSLGKKFTTAIMCAEKYFWKCHRRLLSDFLNGQGVSVVHIFDYGNVRPHKLTSGAVITENQKVIYPKAPELFRD